MERLINKLNKLSHVIAQAILLAMAGLITLDVLGRWIFKQPITGTVDFTEIGLALVIFLSFAYTHIKEEHITIDFVVEQFSKRVQLLFSFSINLIIAMLMVIITWSTATYALRLYRTNTVTGDLNIPLYPIVFLASIGLGLFALTACLHVFYYWKKAVRNDES